MKRKAEEALKKWLLDSNRHPLIIRGARQTGKSTLVRIFCENEKIDLVEINLEKVKIPEFDNERSFNIQNAINQIEAITGIKIQKNSLLFLDEIQEQPYAVKWLRYFFEERPDIPVIAAGSLLEVVLSKKTIEMPVGRIQYFHLGPMTFSEFVWAKDREQLAEYLFQFDQINKIPEQFHKEFLGLLKEYYFVGGMPEAIKEYLREGPLEATEVHRRILQTYEEDLKKYATDKTKEALIDIFQRLPAYVGEKTIYSKLSSTKSTNTREAISLLSLARIIYQSFHSDCSGIPISATEDRNTSALFFLDVGLMNSMLGLSYNDIMLLNPDKLITTGKIAEQFVASHLAFKDEGKTPPNLNFYLRDKHPQKAQIDFVLQQGQKIIPIEVKAGATGRMRSLQLFAKEKNISWALRLDCKYRKKLQEAFHAVDNRKVQLINLPLYQVEMCQTLFSTDKKNYIS